MKLAIIGATGLVGKTLLALLQERKFPHEELLLVASAASAGQQVWVADRSYQLIDLPTAVKEQPMIAIFATDATVATAWAPRFAAIGTVVVDNSAAWRLHPNWKLIVPEVNERLLSPTDRLIANPNCVAISLVMALAPLHRHYGLKRLVIATYQAVSGSGQAGVDQLMAERSGLASSAHQVYLYPIDQNVIPHIGDFLEDGYTQEEQKLVDETQKILEAPTLPITATAVRIPTLRAHAIAVNVELAQDFTLAGIIQDLQAMPGVVVTDAIQKHAYPTCIAAQHTDTVFVGRVRKDTSQPRTLNLWIVADNLRKGAATNALQIAESWLALRG